MEGKKHMINFYQSFYIYFKICRLNLTEFGIMEFGSKLNKNKTSNSIGYKVHFNSWGSKAIEARIPYGYVKLYFKINFEQLNRFKMILIVLTI